MIAASSFEGRNVAVFGLGGSGIVAAQALLAGGSDVIAWDDNENSVGNARAVGIRCENLRKIDWAKIDTLLLAPGVPLTHPEPHWSVKLAQQHGVEIIGDVEVFQRELKHSGKDAKFVAITGTNGKSTTTALIAHVLKHAGLNVQMGGNIGRAVLDLDPIEDGTVYVVECSSYQIDLAPTLAPDIGVLLNITPDHLDRHGTIANYAEIKSRLVLAATVAAIGLDDDYCADIAQKRDNDAKLFSFSNSKELAKGTYLKGQSICTAEAGKAITLIDLGAAKALAGPHNAQNAAAATIVAGAFGLTHQKLEAAFESFQGLAHRMERVAEIDDVLYVNDSKATNAEAVSPALASYQKIHWILGGVSKAEGIAPLIPQFGNVVHAYLIGEAAQEFSKVLETQNVPFSMSETMGQAVEDAHENASSGEVVLLSPACASFDQYRNFELRGDAFKAKVKDLLHK